MSDTDIKDRIRSAMFSGMSMSLRDDLCEMLDDLWFETATQAAALTDAEATIAALTQANASLAQDNARLAKRVDALHHADGVIYEALRVFDSVFDSNGVGVLNRTQARALRAAFETHIAARAWLAGGDA